MSIPNDDCLQALGMLRAARLGGVVMTTPQIRMQAAQARLAIARDDERRAQDALHSATARRVQAEADVAAAAAAREAATHG